jgi:hypothetical protein
MPISEWICLATFVGLIGLSLSLAFRPLVARGGLRTLLVLGTLVVLSPMWWGLWICVAAYIGDATGWFRIADQTQMQ